MNEILKFERYFVDKSCIFILYVKIMIANNVYAFIRKNMFIIVLNKAKFNVLNVRKMRYAIFFSLKNVKNFYYFNKIVPLSFLSPFFCFKSYSKQREVHKIICILFFWRHFHRNFPFCSMRVSV